MSAAKLVTSPGLGGGMARRAARGHGVVALAAALVLLGGCGTDETDAAMVDTGRGSTPAPQACASEAKPVDLPAAFPAAAALPDGYLVTGVQTRSAGRTVITAVAPKPFEQTLNEMRTAYSTRGWSTSEGEIEERDAESNFDGNGLRGRWAIGQIPHCADNTSVSLLIGK